MTLPLSHLPYYLIALLVSGVIHEAGHAIAAARYHVWANDLNIARVCPNIQLTYSFTFSFRQRKNTSVINGHLSVHIIPWSLCRTFSESLGNHVSYSTTARRMCGCLAQLYSVCSGRDLFIKRRFSVLTPNGRLEANGQRSQCCQCSSGTVQCASKSLISYVFTGSRQHLTSSIVTLC